MVALLLVVLVDWPANILDNASYSLVADWLLMLHVVRENHFVEFVQPNHRTSINIFI